jgi:dTDP-4-dehydrorhamnose 3,5-epimerase|tara:strand:- start:244 stop:768 length:525 start_codon:yes stop_codon:yes gene_type:complete
MKKIKTNIKGLIILKGKTFYDARGFLRETFKKKIIKKNLIFTIISKSNKNVLRGLHLQTKNAQDKYISVLKGKILDVAVDLRKNSKTFGKHFKLIISEKNSKSFFIPKGFAHGFLGLDKENIVLYGCTNYRSKNHEVSLLWNDPDLKINWGVKKPILSSKDNNAITLKRFLRNK